MLKSLAAFSFTALLAGCVMFTPGPKEYHVAVTGNDAHDGSVARPLRTIQAAANRVQPGETVTVHAGVYRERVSPPRGGTSDTCRITYQAAPGEKVTITGSDSFTSWEKVSGDVWKLTLPNSTFGDFNPYAQKVNGDWYSGNGRAHSRGNVYLNGHWLAEAQNLSAATNSTAANPMWFAEVETGRTTLHACFPGINPNDGAAEVCIRPTVFTPEQTNRDYITLRGFDLRNAATTWAPPTSGQIGLVSAYWCKGWIIENNEISYSRCTGITLGKYSDQWDNKRGTAEGYCQTIDDAIKKAGWAKGKIGSHRVRNNRIHHCGQSGIVGGFGGAFSRIEGNEIYEIDMQGIWSGAEQAGIKLHGAIDTVISGNHIYRTTCGIWLDWMAQGSRISGNLLHDNTHAWDVFGDLLMEADHGPYVVDNNIMLSPRAVISCESHGGAYIHNYFGGSVRNLKRDVRRTPIMKPHETDQLAIKAIPVGDTRFLNNLFAQGGDLTTWDKTELPMMMAGNAYLNGTRPSAMEKDPAAMPDMDPAAKLVQKPDGWNFEIRQDHRWAGKQPRQLVTSAILGKAQIVDMAFENPDGTPLKFDTDYFGRPRSPQNPFPGPFGAVKKGQQEIKVWPIGSRPTASVERVDLAAAPAVVTAADLVGLWKYEFKGRGYEREFRADGSFQTYVACGDALPGMTGCRWKIDGNRILITTPGASDRVVRLAAKDRLEFVTENISAVRDSATVPYPVPDRWWQSRHTNCCAVAAKGGMDVLFLGDSITHGWENAGKAVWDREIAPLRPANFGFSGDHTENVLWRLMNGELPATLQPKVAVLMIGTNNSGYRWGKHMEKPDLIAAGILAIVDQLRAHNPKTQILLLGIFPRGPSPADLMRQNNEAVNRILAKLDGQKNLKYLDLGALFLAADGRIPGTIMPDLLHPNENGYRIWATAIVPEIRKMLATTP